jgi:hypothetical protein
MRAYLLGELEGLRRGWGQLGGGLDGHGVLHEVGDAVISQPELRLREVADVVIRAVLEDASVPAER